ncbi:radical SAM family heme chaperone HemW [Dehalobacterium formicoaceticum]|uniref:Heme chaperone HemW n=1 Tax=Dehalobacterium formicoaceticum TaxID=51515 RepID=A0ABT1Y251_9FIRM|nr:radical SAM family heme chaperone HemW [Dehalobacterium formicoaceticum]MCR6544947.1 radical SAM family heme chaperone HemW [Dehalobacterium formicoaceticum]
MSLSEVKEPLGMTGAVLPQIEALYVHIPFCLRKCNYCDFVSYPLEILSGQEYCQALVQEIKLYHKHLSPRQKKIKSIYFGGGTPTCLPVFALIFLLSEVQNLFPVAANGEITVECNPLTVNQEYLTTLKEAGVNRLSIGAQSFDEKLLKEMGRSHGVRDIIKTVEDARAAGFTNISLDLIYGLPGQTKEQWDDTLKKATALPVTHLSVYGLHLSSLSPWGKGFEDGSLTLPSEDDSADLQEMAMDYLETKGFDHYEISNYALPKFFSVHNRVYWNNGNYLGVGLAAASHWADIRQTNTSSLAGYMSKVQAGKFPVKDWERLDRETIMAETVFLGLRLLYGFDTLSFKKHFGVDFMEKYQPQVIKLSRLGLIKQSESRVSLTKQGIFLANEVFMEFLP